MLVRLSSQRGDSSDIVDHQKKLKPKPVLAGSAFGGRVGQDACVY
jgi:hypothetical protein